MYTHSLCSVNLTIPKHQPRRSVEIPSALEGLNNPHPLTVIPLDASTSLCRDTRILVFTFLCYNLQHEKSADYPCYHSDTDGLSSRTRLLCQSHCRRHADSKQYERHTLSLRWPIPKGVRLFRFCLVLLSPCRFDNTNHNRSTAKVRGQSGEESQVLQIERRGSPILQD